jgi:hypothetical protein
MSGRWFGIRPIRVVIGAAGVLLATFGAFRLLTEIPAGDLLWLAVWLSGALVLHDAVLSPGIVGVGILLRRVPARARTYVQGALIAGGIVTVVAIPLIYRAGTQPAAEVLLEQDFGANLAVLLAVVSVVAVLAYLYRVTRERSSAGPASTRSHPPSDGDA